MKRTVKLLALLLVLMLIPISFGSADEIEVTAPGTYPIVNEPYSLTAYMSLPNSTYDINQNEFIKWMEAKTNIHLDIVASAASDKVSVRNVLLASGNYPEIMIGDFDDGFYVPDLATYGMEEEILLPLNDLIEEYGYYYKKLIIENPDYSAGFTAPDGNIYGFAMFREGISNYANNLTYVNTDLLEKVNLDPPTTIEEFHDMLVAFKEYDSSIVPYTGTTLSVFGTYILESYVEIDTILQKLTGQKDGELFFAPITDEFREACKTLNSWYKEGLIDPGAFTNGWDEGKQLTNSQIAGVIELQHNGCMDSDPATLNTYRVLAPVVGPEGVQLTSTVSPYNYSALVQAVITDECKRPDIAYRYLDSWYDPEVTYTKKMGPEGMGWEYNEDDSILDLSGKKLVALALPQGDIPDEIWKNRGLGDVGPENWSEAIYNSMNQGAGPDDDIWSSDSFYNTRRYVESSMLVDYLYDGIPCRIFVEDTEGALNALNDLYNYWLGAFAEFVIGTRDPYDDATWDSYLKDLEALNYQYMLDQYNAGLEVWMNYRSNPVIN